MRQLLSGVLSGLCATAPMTLVMILIHRMLPWDEKAPLPPYQIAMEASEEAGTKHHEEDDHERMSVALISHFGFGAGAGGVYGVLARAIPASGVPGGVVYGLIVWAANYLGLLPVAGLYRSPSQESLRRHAMMITAHVVWGAVLGLLFERVAARRQRAPGTGRQRPTMPASGERYSF